MNNVISLDDYRNTHRIQCDSCNGYFKEDAMYLSGSYNFPDNCHECLTFEDTDEEEL